jgi:LAO/AO transport system kinase
MTEADAILQGDRGALARGLTLVENGGDQAAALLDSIWPQAQGARRIGLTGPPGAGKSTLSGGLVRLLCAEKKSVGVLAVDPTSPFSGGALLGDRHRLSDEAKDATVFMRSLASRGASGGLARAAPDALDLVAAAGFDVVLVETVGVGQTELEVAGAADSVVVVLSPESGDAVQAMKAGLLEIADVLCVNKADREGTEALASALESTLDNRPDDLWRPPVVCTEATRDAEPLFTALRRHENWLAEEDRLSVRRRKGMEARLRRLVESTLCERLLAGAADVLSLEADEVSAGRRSVRSAAARAAEAILK